MKSFFNFFLNLKIKLIINLLKFLEYPFFPFYVIIVRDFYVRLKWAEKKGGRNDLNQPKRYLFTKD